MDHCRVFYDSTRVRLYGRCQYDPHLAVTIIQTTAGWLNDGCPHDTELNEMGLILMRKDSEEILMTAQVCSFNTIPDTVGCISFGLRCYSKRWQRQFELSDPYSSVMLCLDRDFLLVPSF